MARETKEEFLRRFSRPRCAQPAEPSHTDSGTPVTEMTDEELSAEIRKRERDVREARERELAAYQELDAAEEGGGRPDLFSELRKRGHDPTRRHY
jgi:hypothetical protein